MKWSSLQIQSLRHFGFTHIGYKLLHLCSVTSQLETIQLNKMYELVSS
jgi:hypothetical protein